MKRTKQDILFIKYFAEHACENMHSSLKEMFDETPFTNNEIDKTVLLTAAASKKNARVFQSFLKKHNMNESVIRKFKNINESYGLMKKSFKLSVNQEMFDEVMSKRHKTTMNDYYSDSKMMYESCKRLSRFADKLFEEYDDNDEHIEEDVFRVPNKGEKPTKENTYDGPVPRLENDVFKHDVNSFMKRFDNCIFDEATLQECTNILIDMLKMIHRWTNKNNDICKMMIAGGLLDPVCFQHLRHYILTKLEPDYESEGFEVLDKIQEIIKHVQPRRRAQYIKYLSPLAATFVEYGGTLEDGDYLDDLYDGMLEEDWCETEGSNSGRRKFIHKYSKKFKNEATLEKERNELKSRDNKNVA